MNMTEYDDQNIFARILSGEIPAKTVHEDDHVLVIHDAYPKAKVHLLVIPKRPHISMTDYSRNATAEETLAVTRAIGTAVEEFELDDDGYRIIANTGQHGGQEVAHLHFHILGGERLGPMICK